MILEISGISDKGCVRDHNEDMVLIGDDIFRDDSRHVVINTSGENWKYFVAVADGMGGHNAGEVASEMVLREMKRKINTLEANLSEKALSEKIHNWVKEIHLKILNEGAKDSSKKGMGTTLIGVLFYNENAFLINVGDSRLYRFRGGNLMQMSKDHSLREMAKSQNIASNIILNSFGGGEKIFVDFERVGGKLIDNDILLLCSDGLSDMLTDDEIESILGKEDPIHKLVEGAKNKGGEDNISAVLVKIHLNNELKQDVKNVKQI